MELNPYRLDVKVDPKNIDYLNRIFEGYDNLCVVSTVDNVEGILMLRGYGKVGPVKRILKGLPFECTILGME